MFQSNFRPSLLLAAAIIAGAPSASAAPKSQARSSASSINSEAFRSAIVIDAATGKVLFEDRADVQNPPASVTKLMTFCLVEDRLKEGTLTLDTPVTITAEASHTGGTRVWLVDKEQITVENLLYALMLQSANDAAVALADHVAGSKEAFVDLMNLKARELGMEHTVYHSPHGLPPDRRKGQEADLSTARDLATLARKLITDTDVLKYTSTRHREFTHKNGKVIDMDNHDHLLSSVPGCDGLKTGYYSEAGYSIAATAQRGGRRIIVVVLGSPSGGGRQPWDLRDTVTTQLIERGFAALPPAIPQIASAPAGSPAPTAAKPTGAAAVPATAPAVASAATTAAPPAVAPAQSDDTSALKLIPLAPGEKPETPGGDASTEPTVHVTVSGGKR